MELLTYARLGFASSMVFHISFAALGIGLPLFMSLTHFLGLRREDPELLGLSERFKKPFAVLFAVGTVTGTTVGFQLNTLWPKFMAVAGELIALPLFLELWAFLIEAVFFGIYIYGKRWIKNPWVHWATSIPIVLASAASGFFITTANAFMNAPVGFEIVNGELTNVQPLMAMFNPATLSKTTHTLFSTYTVTAFALAALAAWGLWRSLRSQALPSQAKAPAERTGAYRKLLHITLVSGLIFSLGSALTGDISAKYLAKYQPIKLAAIEGLFETQARAPLALFGIPDAESQTLKGAIEIPGALSFLAFNDFNAPVTGLNEFAQELWPPLWIHITFDIMVVAGVYLIGLGGLYVYRHLRKQKPLEAGWWYAALIAGAPLAWLAMQTGWITAEVGRVPWIVVGVMKIADAVTDSTGLAGIFWGFLALYTVIGTIVTIFIKRMLTKRPLEADVLEAERWLAAQAPSPQVAAGGVH